MKGVYFDPINGEGEKVSIHQIYSFRHKSKKQKSIVIMCRHCKSILHQSRAEQIIQTTQQRPSTAKDVLVSSFKNTSVSCEADRLLFYCNICAQEIGEVNQPSFSIILKRANILPAFFEWKQRKQKKEESVPVGCYSGVSLNNVEKIITRIVYMKCRRYQETMHRFQKNMKETLKAFFNFILLINIYKAEGDSSSIPSQFPKIKATNNQQMSSNRISLAKQKGQASPDAKYPSVKKQSKYKDINDSRCPPCLPTQCQTNPTLPSIREQQD